MKKPLFFFSAFLALSIANGQQQLENPGFENWDDATGPYIEPSQWSSIKTSDASSLNPSAPQVVDRSTDAHSGTYSLYLENKTAFTIVANGIVTNGQVHADINPNNGYVFTNTSDAKWNTAFTDKPDSIVGWYKYTPSSTDHGKVDVILHTSTSFNFPGDEDGPKQVARARFDLPNSTISSWKRFSKPFHYFNSSTPEYILVVLTSGDSTLAKNGSKAWFDDIELIYNPLNVEEMTGDDIAVGVSSGDLMLWGKEGIGEMVNVELINLQGQVIGQKRWNPSYSTEWILNNVHGVYLLRFFIEDRWVSKKIYIE